MSHRPIRMLGMRSIKSDFITRSLLVNRPQNLINQRCLLPCTRRTVSFLLPLKNLAFPYISTVLRFAVLFRYAPLLTAVTRSVTRKKRTQGFPWAFLIHRNTMHLCCGASWHTHQHLSNHRTSQSIPVFLF